MNLLKALSWAWKTVINLPLIITQIIGIIFSYWLLVAIFGGIMQKFIELHWQIFLFLSIILVFVVCNWIYWIFRYFKELYFKDLGKYISLHLVPDGLQIAGASNIEGCIVVIRCYVDNFPKELSFEASAKINYGAHGGDEISLKDPILQKNILTFKEAISKDKAAVL